MIFKRPTVVLAYHRVCSLHSDPQLLSVSPENFAHQMKLVAKHFAAVRLSDLSSGKVFYPNASPRVVITFDDGYADNLINAMPILVDLKIPATFFITAGMIDSTHEFWWDELENIFLSNLPLPNILRIDISGKTHVWSGLQRWDVNDNSSWNVLGVTERLPTSRQKAYLELSSLIHPLPYSAREYVMESLFDWASRLRVARLTHKTLTSEEVFRLNQSELMEVGGHSINHELFYELPEYRQKQEISGSKAILEKLLKCEITSFAYPFGGKSHYSTWAPLLVKEAGFMRACSNFPELFSDKCDPYQIPRFLVRNWGGEEFLSNLKKWLSDFR